MYPRTFLSLLAIGISPYSLANAQSSCSSLPLDIPFNNNTHLPDPFTFLNGTRATTLSSFQCRQAEILSLLQRYELGVLPPPPQKISSSLTGSNLSITVTENAKSITFYLNITYPTSGTPPYPALIAFDAITIPIPDNVAVILFTDDDIAQQNNMSSRGLGKFYDLYGSSATASALTAWAWAVSRIIDVIDTTPSLNIKPSKVGVTGCSRDGKGALVAGALDSRIALTIPQESGSGGSACWRLSDYMLDVEGVVTQTAHEIVTENVWESRTFELFANTSVDLLPFDHHMLAGLVSPRGLYVPDNLGYDWLGPWSSLGCMQSAALIYQAMGAQSNIGYSIAANHSHCEFPESQVGELNNFIQKFLFDDETVNTEVRRVDSNLTFDQGYWDNWAVPNLQ